MAFATRNALVTAVPKRRAFEQWSGQGADREVAAAIDGFRDLWKATLEQPTVRNVYAFHDAFVSLVFGQSMLERLTGNGRVQSYLFTGGRGTKVGLFQDWLSVLQGPHCRVVIGQPLFTALAWVCQEHAPLLEPADLARDWFAVRSPSRPQIDLCQAIFEGFLLGYNSWALWDYVVSRTRQQLFDQRCLETWRGELAKRYGAITQFHAVIESYYRKPVSSHDHGHFEFDSAAHRRYLDREIQKLLDYVSALAALALDEAMPDACVARFADWLLVQGKPNALATEKIADKLAAAFNGATFPVGIEEAR
jgi:hypothetical protein